MRKACLAFCLLAFVALQAFAGSSWKETRTILYTPPSGEKGIVLNPNHSFSQDISTGSPSYPVRRFLRVVGGLKMPAPFDRRGEEMFRRAEYHIDDNLDSIVRKQDRYSLYFKGANENFERHAYYRISGSWLKPGELTLTLPVIKKQNLALSATGDFGVEIELFYKKAGRAPDDIYDVPDSILRMPIAQGSSKYRAVKQTFVLPDNVACALLRIGGTHFSGECWVEAPRLTQKGREVCTIPFTRFADKRDHFNYWIGTNMSTRSWPMWKLEFNGETVFQGNIFDRASNIPDFYIPLPASVGGKGELKLTLQKEPHRAAYPFELRSLELIEESARDFEVIAIPKYVTQNGASGILVEANKPGVRLKIESPLAVPAQQEVVLNKRGLHVVEFRAGKAGMGLPFTISDGNRTEQVEVGQVIEKLNEQIYLSSGDEVHIDKEYTPYDYFFKWCFANRIGNWYHFRPSYQWSGVRVANPEVIGHYTGLLEQLKVPYAWQVEGRTLASKKINPLLEALATTMFRGMQAHENDGGYYYWQHFDYQGVFSDMAARNRPYGGIFAKHRPIYTDRGTFIHYDPQGVTDMADGARKLVANLRYSKGESTRHTGPSTVFRYLYQAGYEWLGAEQMYGPEEIILSSLRGASRAYSRLHYGSLHAMQWGSAPFTDPKHALRLYMSLALAYMHGSSHINTEEALWIDEYANDRFSQSGKEHLFAQHQVLNFIETHSRRGEQKSNVAVIQGRNDAWKCFVRGSAWSQEGDKWKFSKADESFDLLRVFYPGNIVNNCGPNGWFSATPYGTIDLLPVEAPGVVMNKYKALIFLGWNSYDEADFLRLRDFVFDGGTLLLSGAHLNAELQPDQPVRFPENDAPIRQMLGSEYQKLTVKTEMLFGNGKIIYFPAKSYPAESALTAQYEAAMNRIGAEISQAEMTKGWIKQAPAVGFATWDAPDRRTLYLLNTDWDSKTQQQEATFVCNGKQFLVPVRRYHIETIHCARGVAAMPHSNTTDVLSIAESDNSWTIKVQSTESDTVRFMNTLTGKTDVRQFDKPGIHQIVVLK